MVFLNLVLKFFLSLNLVFFFQFYALILGLIGIRFYNMFWFIFYGVIMISWPGFVRLTWVDSDYFFLFLIDFFSTSLFDVELIDNWISYIFFFKFILQYWVDWKLDFIMFFFMRLSWFYSSDHGFDRLIRVEIDGFLCPFLNWFFSFIVQYQVDWKLSFIIFFYEVIYNM